MSKPTLWLRAKFPYTHDLVWAIQTGALFATVSGVLFVAKVPAWMSWSLLVLSLVFFGLELLVFILELLSKVFSPVKSALKGLRYLLKALSRIYISVLSLFLRPVVEHITESRATKDSTHTLRNLPDHDDSYLNEVLDFEKLRSVQIKLSSSSAYWRFGIKFSSQAAFTEPRVSSNHPLYHLAKDEQNNIVYRVYYDENENQRQNENLIESYDGSPIIIEIDKKDGLRIVVKNAQGEELISEKYPRELHKYGRVFAWGDRRDYAVTANIEKRMK
jgi:hypothetical protein